MSWDHNMSEGDRKMNRIRYAIAAAASAAALVASGGSAFADGVSPNVNQAADPGEVIHLTKTVSTPPIPPKPDIVLLVDKTGSMGGELANRQATLESYQLFAEEVMPHFQGQVAPLQASHDWVREAPSATPGMTRWLDATTTAIRRAIDEYKEEREARTMTP